MSKTKLYRKTVLALLLGVGALLSACSATTTVSGTVTDGQRQALARATITLRHTEQLFVTEQTDAQGRYNITLKERCLFICAGGNPSLTAQIEGYTAQSINVPQTERSEHNFILE